MSAFDPEVRQGVDPRSVVYATQRVLYRDEHLRDTKETFEGHVKKIKAQVDMALANHYSLNVSDVIRGAYGLYEPNVTDCYLYQMFTIAGGLGTIKYDIIGGSKYRSIPIADQGLLMNSAIEMRYYSPWEYYDGTVQAGNYTALFFDGLDDSLDLGNDATLWSKALTKFSFCFWIYAIDGWQGSFRTILDHGYVAGSNQSFILRGDDGDGGTNHDLSFIIKDSGGVDHRVDASGLSVGAWYHIVCVYDSTLGSQNMKVYINTSQKATADFNGTINLSANMRLAGTGLEDFYGFIRDFQWFDGTALSTTQINSIYKRRDAIAPTPTYRLKMDEGGGYAYDSISGTKKGSVASGAYNGPRWYVPNRQSEHAWILDGPMFPMAIKHDANSLVDCGAQTAIWSKSLTKFSFSIWVYLVPDFEISGGYATFVGCADDPSNNDEMSIYFLKGNTDTAIPYDSIGVDVTNDGYTTTNLKYSSSPVFAGQWYHVVVVYDSTLGSANLKLYVNGTLASATAGDINATGKTINIDSVTHMFLGGYIVSEVNGFRGYMRDFRFWSGTAITGADALKVYLDDPTAPAPNYKLPMQEGVGTPIDTIGSKTTSLLNGAFYGVPTLMGPQYAIGLNVATTDPLTGLVQNRHGQLLSFGTSSFQDFDAFDGLTATVDTADSASLDLLKFSIAAWFKTSLDYTISGSNGTLLSKGGFGSDTGGQNDNYSLQISGNINKLKGGFEETTGTDHYAGATTDSPFVNDGQWHLGVVTYDQVNVNVWLDGVQIVNHTTGTTPETNANILRQGANPRALDTFFAGQMRDTRVWNNNLTNSEIQALWNTFSSIPQSGAVVYTRKTTYANNQRSLSTSDYDWVNQNFSEQIWFKPTSIRTNGNSILKMHNADGTHGYSIEIAVSDKKVFIEFNNAGTTTRIESQQAIQIGGGPNMGWYHLVYTWQNTGGATNVLTGRLNDIPMVSSSKTGHGITTAWGAYPLYGGHPNAGTIDSEEFNGELSFMIYYRSAALVKFDGVNDQVDCTNDANIWSKALSKFSMSFWVYPTAVAGGITRFYILHGSGAQNFQVHQNNTNGDLIFRIRDSGAVTKDAVAAGVMVANQWHFVVCVYDNSLASANVKIYVNGVVGATTANLTQTINQSATLFVGGDGANGLQGYMKHFKFWSGTALSHSQVCDLTGGNLGNNITPTPSYYIPMLERSGNCIDAINNIKQATPINGAAWNTDAPDQLLPFEMTNLYNYGTRTKITNRRPMIAGFVGMNTS